VTGVEHRARIFVAALGASNFTYAEARRTETLPDWIGCHVNALAAIGGVPKALVPDNLKAGVTKPSRFEPGINRTYQDLADHYGCVALPTRIIKPHPEQGFRSCLSIIGLGRTYGIARLEAAARRGNTIGATSYGSIASILKHGLDKAFAIEPTPVTPPIRHGNIRGSGYFH
jgi:transposase